MSSDLNLNLPKTNLFGERYFQEINHSAFEKSSAEDVFRPYYQEYLDESEAIYIVIGTDSGLLKQYLEENLKHRFCQFVFVEFDEVLEVLELGVDEFESLTDKDRQVWLFNQDFAPSQLNRAFGHYVIRRRIHLIKSLAVMDAKPGTPYAELWERFEVLFKTYLSAEMNSQSVKVFEEQRQLNVADNVIPAVELGPCIEGRDAVILGGGPTLDDAIDWVRENQDRLIIFAAARIAKRMEKEGILVDFFVTVDPFPWSFDNSKSVLTHADYSILVHSFHAQHRLISQWSGLSCYLGSRFGWQSENEKPNFDGPGPTVTNTALHVAATLGAKRLFLAGIDFCYAKGKTHESSSVEAQHNDTMAHHGKAMLVDNAGNMTETGDDFYSAKLAMESMIHYYLTHKPHLEFISLGLHSAKMERVQFMPPEEVVIDAGFKQDLIEEIKLDLTLSVNERIQLTQNLLGMLEDQSKRFDKLHKVASDAVVVCDKLYDKSANLVEKHAKKIQKLKKKVFHLVGKDGDFLTSYHAALFSDSFKPIEDESAMSNDQIVEQLESFFGGMKSVSHAMQGMLERSIERAQLRLDELENKKFPSELFTQWQKWGEFGRALQWKGWHGDQHLNEVEALKLDEAIVAFEEEFEKTDHQYQKRLESKVNNVSKILARANNAFSRQDIQEIELIINHVKDLASAQESHKSDFLRLLTGMKSELEGNLVDAFNAYEPITLPSLRHMALKKMLPIALALEDYEAALTVLQRLVEIHLDYMVPYADMLKVLGNLDGAIEVLFMYLQKNPEKLSIKNKLAQFYLEADRPDHTQVLVAQVLAKDPGNKAALLMQEQLEHTSQ